MQEKVNSFFKLAVLLTLLILHGCADSDEDSKYKIEYVAPVTGEVVGKTVFDIKVTDNDTEEPVAGLTITISPLMHLGGEIEATPIDSILDKGNGTYTCTIYYRAAAIDPADYWELRVTASDGSEDSTVATFYPDPVAIGTDTPTSKLKGQADMIAGTIGDEQRTYYIFNDGAFTNISSFDMFIAAKESMTSFQALYPGVTLNEGDITYELTANSVSVLISSDSGASFLTATHNGSGHWSAAGLAFDNASTVYVELTIAGEQKTTDGLTPDGAGNISTTNEFAPFSVTPGTW